MRSPRKRLEIRSLAAAVAALSLAMPAFAQESLPASPRHSGSKTGPTIAASNYSPPPANAPNVVIIMLDNVGPALPHTFGALIKCRPWTAW